MLEYLRAAKEDQNSAVFLIAVDDVLRRIAADIKRTAVLNKPLAHHRLCLWAFGTLWITMENRGKRATKNHIQHAFVVVFDGFK